MVGSTSNPNPPSAVQGSVQAPPSTATWTRHFPPTLFPTLPSLRSSSSTLSTIVCFVCDLLLKRQKKVPNRYFLPNLFPSLASLTPPPPHSLYPNPPHPGPTTPKYDQNIQLTSHSFHLGHITITNVHHLTKKWPNWPKYEQSLHYITHYCTPSSDQEESLTTILDTSSMELPVGGEVRLSTVSK